MKRGRFRLCALSAIVAASLAGAVAPAAARGVTVVGPGESIQAAVDAASPGATIVVKPGSYAEQVTITTDGITLRGHGATLVPPATPAADECSAAFGQNGICALGDLDTSDPEAPPVVNDPISDVTVSGFTVKGFEASGILFLGAEDPVAIRNDAVDNGEYGIARFFSSGGRVVGNTATGSEEAGIYVGDSPDADALLVANETYDNELFGFFLRDAANGRVIANSSHGNCIGAIVLNTGANIAASWRFFGNRIEHNDNFCPGDEEEGTPPLSGVGVLIANASDTTVAGNIIRDNTPSGASEVSGGVVVLDLG